MPRARRLQFPGAFYHIFNRGVEKRPIFFQDADRKFFLKLISETIHSCRVRLFAYCLMNNHFHLFLQVSDSNLHEVLKNIQGRYAQYINLRYDRVGFLFQGRYKSRLVNEEEYALVLTRYIHQNPLRAGLVERLDEYVWSSFPSYIGKLPAWDWLETDWILRHFHTEPEVALRLFHSFHQAAPQETELSTLEKMRPYLGTPKGPDPGA